MGDVQTKTLAQLRAAVREQADMVNSQFVTDSTLTSFINSSLSELHDLLIQKFGNNYAVAPPFSYLTDGTSDRYALPEDFYKLLGVDLDLGGDPAMRVTLRPFNFSDRNKYVYPHVTPMLGRHSNLRYKLVGNTIWFTPRPQSNLTLTLWYVPRMAELVNDADVADGVSGWLEYVVVDSAIKCLMKEESDVSAHMARKEQLRRRIEEAAENRDAGFPMTVSDTRRIGRGEWWGWGDDGSA